MNKSCQNCAHRHHKEFREKMKSTMHGGKDVHYWHTVMICGLTAKPADKVCGKWSE